jgi:hypothetical protein
MDTTALREIVKEVFLKYAALRPSHGDIRLDAVLDLNQDRYALIQVGWDRGRRIRGLLLYIALHQDGRIHVEYDGMENGITDELVHLGVPEEQIVLAYLSAAAV